MLICLPGYYLQIPWSKELGYFFKYYFGEIHYMRPTMDYHAQNYFCSHDFLFVNINWCYFIKL